MDLDDAELTHDAAKSYPHFNNLSVSFARSSSFNSLKDSASVKSWNFAQDVNNSPVPETDALLVTLANALRTDKHSFKKFIKIKWDNVENRFSPFMKTLQQVIEDNIYIQLDEDTYSSIVYRYMNNRGKFNHKQFLKDLIQCIENQNEKIANDNSNSSASVSSSIDKPNIRKIVHNIAIINNIGTSTIRSNTASNSESIDYSRCSSASTREILIEKLRSKMLLKYPLRMHINVDDWKRIGSLNEEDFGRELKRVYDLTLTNQERHVLFDLFDHESVGFITAAMLHEGLSKIVINHLKQADKESSNNLLFADSSSHHSIHSKHDQSVDSRLSLQHSSVNTFLESHYKYSPQDFDHAILKLSSKYKDIDPNVMPPQLHVPDGYLNRKFVKRAIKDQLGVRLTNSEIDALCHKLSYVSTDERAALITDLNENPKFLFVGKSLKALIVRISHITVHRLPSITGKE